MNSRKLAGKRVVLFDVDNTLIYYDVENYYRVISKVSGASFQEIKGYVDKLNDLVDGNRIGEKEFARRTTERFGLPKRFLDYRGFYTKGRYRMRPWKRMFAIVNRIHGRYRTGTLSNVGPERDAIRRKMLKGAKLDYLFNSYELRAVKPSKKAFSEVLKALKARPQDVVFVDDKKKNVEAAQRQGINGVHFTGAQGLKKEFKRLGIELQ